MFKRTIAMIVIVALMVPLTFAIASEEKVIFKDSFEEPFSKNVPKNWELFGAAAKLKAETTLVSDGKQAFSVLDEATDGGGGAQSPMIPIKEGLLYTFSIKAYVKSGNCSMFVKFFDKSNKQIFNKSTSATAVGQWTDLAASYKAPEGAAKAGVVICINNASVGDVIFDDFKVIEGELSNSNNVIGVGIPPVQTETKQSTLITPKDENLVYSTYNEQGDMLSDFSSAGFYAGEVELPILENLPVAATIEPSADKNADDTKRIQKVIDQVASQIPLGKMQVIKLKAGRYNISKESLRLRSGVVLAGEGQGENGTVLYAKDPTTYTTLIASGSAPQPVGDNCYITDEYVKAGSYSVNLSAEDAKKFKVGDLIRITHPSDNEWSKSLGMLNIFNLYNDNTSWDPGEVDMTIEKTITAIEGTKITFDIPFYIPYSTKLSKIFMSKIDDITKISNFGIENLRLESFYTAPDDEKHSNTAITISNAVNGYVRNISAKYYMFAAVRCEINAKQITVQNCSSLEPVSKVAGGRRYSFGCSTSAQQILFTGCYSFDGRHDFSTSYQATGPLVFSDSVTDKSNAASETHGTWTTGVLYDNLYQVNTERNAFISLANHGIYGTSLSQGWCAAGSIVWNSLSNAIVGHKPTGTYNNFLIGTWGRFLDPESLSQKTQSVNSYRGIYRTATQDAAKDENFATSNDTPFVGDCFMEQPKNPVEPRSLYKAQLSLRLNGDYRKTTPNAPIIVSPRSEAAIGNTDFEVAGIYQMGAEKVTVFVNDKAYDAELNKENYTFKVKIPLTDVYAKIYATQTINGVESAKNADRFIKVGKSNMNLLPEHQSIYSMSKTALLSTDTRKTFDQYQKDVNIEVNEITVILRGQKLVMDVKPITRNDRTLVPMRAVFEGFGANVTWDESTKTAIGTVDGRTIKITEDQTTAYFNDIPMKLDSPAIIVDGRFVVPIRFISECFGAKVDWLEPSKTVVITGGLEKYEPKQKIENALTFYNIVQTDPNGGTTVDCLVDGNESSYCGVNGDDGKASFTFDLLKITELGDLHISFQKGEERVYEFAVEVSDDGQNFTRVLDKVKSSGKSDKFEKFSLQGAKGRIVRIVGYGNTVNSWNSYKEVVITKK